MLFFSVSLCCVGSSLCNELITGAEEFYRLCVCVCVCVRACVCVCVCNLKASTMTQCWSGMGCCDKEKLLVADCSDSNNRMNIIVQEKETSVTNGLQLESKRNLDSELYR
jgi:hypothetical protein